MLALAGYIGLTCLIAPIAEEVFFRGLLFPMLRARIGVAWGVVLTGALFSIVHALGSPVEALIVLFVLGAGLCLLYLRTGSLLPCIGLHALNNAISFAATKEMEWPVALLTVVGSVVVTVGIGLAVRAPHGRAWPRPEARRRRRARRRAAAARRRRRAGRRRRPPAPPRRRRSRSSRCRSQKALPVGHDRVVLRKRGVPRARARSRPPCRASRSSSRSTATASRSARCASRCAPDGTFAPAHADPARRAASASASLHAATPALGAARGPEGDGRGRRAARGARASSGPLVKLLQRSLARAALRGADAAARFDAATGRAVMAFRKVNGMARRYDADRARDREGARRQGRVPRPPPRRRAPRRGRPVAPGARADRRRQGRRDLPHVERRARRRRR